MALQGPHSSSETSDIEDAAAARGVEAVDYATAKGGELKAVEAPIDLPEPPGSSS